MHLVLQELESRGLSGDLEPGVGKQAADLSAWLSRVHPKEPPLSAKTIRNKIASRFRALLAARN